VPPLPAWSLVFFFSLEGVAEEEEDLSRASSCTLSGWSDGTRALGTLQSAKLSGLCYRASGITAGFMTGNWSQERLACMKHLKSCQQCQHAHTHTASLTFIPMASPQREAAAVIPESDESSVSRTSQAVSSHTQQFTCIWLLEGWHSLQR